MPKRPTKLLITEQIIDEAWAQLQQLPSPMVEEPKIAHKVAPIEFGELDESVNFAEWIPENRAENRQPALMKVRRNLIRIRPAIANQASLPPMPIEARGGVRERH